MFSLFRGKRKLLTLFENHPNQRKCSFSHFALSGRPFKKVTPTKYHSITIIGKKKRVAQKGQRAKNANVGKYFTIISRILKSMTF